MQHLLAVEYSRKEQKGIVASDFLGPAWILWRSHNLPGVDLEGCLEVVAGYESFSIDSRAIA